MADFRANKVHILDTATGNEIGAFSAPSPARIAVDAGGDLWITQKLSRFYCSNVIQRYTAQGVVLPQTIRLPSTSNPSGISIDSKGRFLICDDGPDQNNKIYTNLATSPAVASTLGAKGGIFSGVAGQAGPLKFNGPTAVGEDNQGNIYVAQESYGPDWDDNGSVGAGATLESYTSKGVRRWVLNGLEFTDTANKEADTNSQLLSPLHQYAINYSSTVAETEWSYDGFTMNRFKYPDDPRDFRDPNNLGGKLFPVSTWGRSIVGRRILFWTGQYGGQLYFDQFNSASDGDIAIPCNNRANAASSKGTWAVWPDTSGTIWESDERGPIYSTSCTGLDAKGNPIWGNPQTTPLPALWNGVERVQYYPDSDTMYLSGYTDANPNATDDWGSSGFVIARYDHWSVGNRTAKYQIITVNDGIASENPKGFDVAGRYIFVSYWSPHHINVYDNITGALVGSFLPGLEVGGPGNVGNVDAPYPVHAFLRPNGEYIVLAGAFRRCPHRGS